MNVFICVSDVVVKIQRLHPQSYEKKQNTTLGRMTIIENDRPVLSCFTLEDGPSPDPDGKKVAGKTRIPAGAYKLDLRVSSPMVTRKAARWKWHQDGMLWLRNVPGFEYIYIHEGNSHDHTEGCILVGYSASSPDAGDQTISTSVDAYHDVYSLLVPKVKEGLDCVVVITDA